MTLKELRISKGLTQKQVAEAVGVTSQAYSNYENSRRDIPLVAVPKIAEILNLRLIEVINAILFNDSHI